MKEIDHAAESSKNSQKKVVAGCLGYPTSHLIKMKNLHESMWRPKPFYSRDTESEPVPDLVGKLSSSHGVILEIGKHE